jgi:hypothetical protein
VQGELLRDIFSILLHARMLLIACAAAVYLLVDDAHGY